MALSEAQEQILLDCLNEIFTAYDPDLEGCSVEDLWAVDKQDLVDAVQNWITDNPGPGGSPQTVFGSIEGFVDAETTGTSNYGTGGSMWMHPSTVRPILPVPPIIAGQNSTCGGQIGTLVINPNLPAGAAGSFDITVEIIDDTAGGGQIRALCTDTGQILSGGGSTGGGGNDQDSPGPTTVTFAIPAGCDPTQIRVVISSWGASSASWGCDELDGAVGSIVVVTPSECLPALQCFAAIFGCSLSEMLNAEAADPETPGGGIEHPETSAITTECPTILGIYHLEWNGTSFDATLSVGPPITVNVTGTGLFDVSVPGAVSYDGIIVEPGDNANRDSITLRCTDLNGGFSTTEGDNGAAANPGRNNDVKITAYGSKTFVTDVLVDGGSVVAPA